jgi:hypothetical protein
MLQGMPPFRSHSRRQSQHETLDIRRGRLRTARKRHECVGPEPEPEVGWFPDPHPIEPGEQYLEMRQVSRAVPENLAWEQEAIPMGSTTFRMCMECAIEDGWATPLCP